MRLLLILLLTGIYSSTYAQNEDSTKISGLLKTYKIIVEKKIWDGDCIGSNWDIIRKVHSNGKIYKNETTKIFPELEGKFLVEGKKEADFYVVIHQYSPELHTVDYIELNTHSITANYSFNITYAQKIELSIYDKKGKLIKNNFINKDHDVYEETFSKVLYNPTYLNDSRETPQIYSQNIREQPEKYLKLNEKIKEALLAYVGDLQTSTN